MAQLTYTKEEWEKVCRSTRRATISGHLWAWFAISLALAIMYFLARNPDDAIWFVLKTLSGAFFLLMLGLAAIDIYKYRLLTSYQAGKPQVLIFFGSILMNGILIELNYRQRPTTYQAKDGSYFITFPVTSIVSAGKFGVRTIPGVLSLPVPPNNLAEILERF